MLSDGYVVSLRSTMLRYSNGTKALKNIDLNLGTSSFQYLTGPSGAGKSSIIKLINMDEKPTAGSVFIFEHDVSELTNEEISSIKQKIGVISQGFCLAESMTVLENVALPLKVMGVVKNEREQQAMEILDWLNIGKNRDDYPCELSCGERQCVTIARALIARPKIILADDPVCYLDQRTANKVINLLFELSKTDTCVLVTNNNEQRKPALLREGREIKITGGMLIDNVISKQVRNELPIAM